MSKLFKKGYKNDAGYDVILQKTIVFKPNTMTSINLDVKCTPKKGTCAMLISRTSAAKQGLIVSMCPIDADYTGNITAIVFNASDKEITYLKGQAFAQLVFIKLAKSTLQKVDIEIKNKNKKRTNGKFGSTGR